MALINCYECGREISSLAPHCIHCGGPKSDNVDATGKPQETAGNVENKSNLGASAGEPTAKQINKVTDSTSRTSESAQLRHLAKVRYEKLINDELEKKTKVSALSIIATIIFLWSIPTTSYGGNPVGTVVGVFSAILAFRCWIERRTYKTILLKKSTNAYFVRIYLPSLWSYFWRSLLTMIGIAVVIVVLGGRNLSKGGYDLAGVIIGFWIMGSVFVVDIPFWVRRKVDKLTSKHGGKTGAELKAEGK
jgi:hypothetical protein